MAELPDELEAVAVDLPLVPGVVRQVGSHRFVNLKERRQKCSSKVNKNHLSYLPRRPMEKILKKLIINDAAKQFSILLYIYNKCVYQK